MKWQYYLAVCKGEELNGKLSELGDDGWEVFKVDTAGLGYDITHTLWCKRSKIQLDISTLLHG